MNLYKILFECFGPRTQAKGIIGFVVAKDDEAIYEFLKSKPRLAGEHIDPDWKYNEEEDENFKQTTIANRGEIEAYEFGGYIDSGFDLYAWELVSEVTPAEIETLRRLKVVEVVL